jgi:hypothetical protein
MVEAVARRYFRVKGFSHLESAIEQYKQFLADTEPDRGFDLEEFGAWLDWGNVLRLKGSDTFSDVGNQAGLQLRWAIGKVLFDAMPRTIPQLYLDFAEGLTATDRVLTLNYDILLERALDTVGLPYRRFPLRFKELDDATATVNIDHEQELVLSKLHGSIDWTFVDKAERSFNLRLQPLVEGPRFQDDPMLRIGVIPPSLLQRYYESRSAWWSSPPNLLPPSTAKPLAGSALIPMWDGLETYSYMLGGFTIVGCSLPKGDPYVVQVVHHIATDYLAGRKSRWAENVYPQRRMKVVTLCNDDSCIEATLNRFRFFDRGHTDFMFDGFRPEILQDLFAV